MVARWVERLAVGVVVRVAVAFSGGVGSGLLVIVLGDAVVERLLVRDVADGFASLALEEEEDAGASGPRRHRR